MAKIFHCTNCDAQYPAWQGRCEMCGKWNTLEEDTNVAGEVTEAKVKKDSPNLTVFRQPIINKQVSNLASTTIQNQVSNPSRLSTGFKEFDRALGGGFVEASFVLLGGEPGVGKSTIVLQVVANLKKFQAEKNTINILYASGEESLEQISLRANRLKLDIKDVDLIQANNLESIIGLVKNNKYNFLVIDSIQTLFSDESSGASGSVSQVRFCADKLMAFAKSNRLTVLLIGHVTKEGVVAGPRTLEHLVDVVLYLEGDKNRQVRILRSSKNRFGSTNEIGIFQMMQSGFKEVTNPSKLFLSDHKIARPGTATSSLIEGQRPLLVEVQALTSTSSFGYPRRVASGVSLSRLNMIIAVLTKHLRLRLNSQDVYVNLVGGLKSKDPGLDLAVALAIISAYKNKKLPKNLVSLGEIGLTGEVRPVSHQATRFKEAKRLGFTKILTSDNYKGDLRTVLAKLF